MSDLLENVSEMPVRDEDGESYMRIDEVKFPPYACNMNDKTDLQQFGPFRSYVAFVVMDPVIYYKSTKHMCNKMLQFFFAPRSIHWQTEGPVEGSVLVPEFDLNAGLRSYSCQSPITCTVFADDFFLPFKECNSSDLLIVKIPNKTQMTIIRYYQTADGISAYTTFDVPFNNEVKDELADVTAIHGASPIEIHAGAFNDLSTMTRNNSGKGAATTKQKFASRLHMLVHNNTYTFLTDTIKSEYVIKNKEFYNKKPVYVRISPEIFAYFCKVIQDNKLKVNVVVVGDQLYMWQGMLNGIGTMYYVTSITNVKVEDFPNGLVSLNEMVPPESKKKSRSKKRKMIEDDDEGEEADESEMDSRIRRPKLFQRNEPRSDDGRPSELLGEETRELDFESLSDTTGPLFGR